MSDSLRSVTSQDLKQEFTGERCKFVNWDPRTILIIGHQSDCFRQIVVYQSGREAEKYLKMKKDK